MTHKIVIANQKGGVGKTTTTINLSAGLAKHGKKVLVIDLDGQANSTDVLGGGKEFDKTIVDVFLEQNINIYEVIQPADIENVWLIPSTPGFKGVDLQLADRIGRENILKKALEGLSDFDYVIMDTPPNLSVITVNALNYADSFIIPVNMCKFAFHGVSDLLSDVEEINKYLRSEKLEFMGVVPTHMNLTVISKEGYKTLAEGVGEEKTLASISQTVKISEAHNANKSIFEYAPTSKAAEEYNLLTEEILNYGNKEAHNIGSFETDTVA